jgi:uncharacterized SAM-binding protein YcdF (DUF218 family)
MTKGSGTRTPRSSRDGTIPPVPTVVADLVKLVFIPGSVGMLVLGVLAGVALLHVPALERWARRWLVALCVLYIVLALPVVAAWLENGTRPPYQPLATDRDAAGVTAIVVLGNGIVSYAHDGLAVESLTRRTAYNAIEGARLYRLLRPQLVVASGGQADPGELRRSEAAAVRDVLIGLGVPHDRIVIETSSWNTATQAAQVAPIVRGHARFALVTSPIHMARAMALFEARGLHPVAAPSQIEYGPPNQSPVMRFVPSPNALRASELSMYELLAMAYAESRGWTDAARDAPQ